MKVELEQNQEELETLQALVEAIWEQQFSTAPALCDPSVPSYPTGMYPNGMTLLVDIAMVSILLVGISSVANPPVSLS